MPPMRTTDDWMNDWRIDMNSMNPKLQDLVEEVMPQEPTYTVIAGRSGIGKTVLALNLAFSLATGSPFYSLKVKQTTVGYLAFEGTKGKMFERLEKVAKNYPPVGNNLRFEIRKPFHLLEKKNEQELLDLASGCQVLFVDPVKYLVGGNYLKPEVVNNFIIKWMDLMDKGKFSSVLCLQVRKENPNSLWEPGDLWEVKGAGDYVESATSVLLLERERQGHNPGGQGFAPVSMEKVVLHFAKHRDSIGDMTPIKLELNRGKLRFDIR